MKRERYKSYDPWFWSLKYSLLERIHKIAQMSDFFFQASFVWFPAEFFKWIREQTN